MSGLFLGAIALHEALSGVPLQFGIRVAFGYYL